MNSRFVVMDVNPYCSMTMKIHIGNKTRGKSGPAEGFFLEKAYAKYLIFSVGSESNKYKLTVGPLLYG